MQVDDIPPHSAYCNCAYEQENQQTNDSVSMLKLVIDLIKFMVI